MGSQGRSSFRSNRGLHDHGKRTTLVWLTGHPGPSDGKAYAMAERQLPAAAVRVGNAAAARGWRVIFVPVRWLAKYKLRWHS